MARPRQFDEDRALDAAMRTFWEYGYEATSTQDLCTATGLGRSSIYNTFRSKRELFARSLARYLDTMAEAQDAVLEDTSRPPAQRVRALLDKIVSDEFDHRPHGRSLGCLGVNSTVELAARDPEAARLLTATPPGGCVPCPPSSRPGSATAPSPPRAAPTPSPGTSTPSSAGCGSRPRAEPTGQPSSPSPTRPWTP